MASDLAAKAKEAFIDDHFELAVDFYSQAIALDPNNPELFSDRAQANIKLKNFTEAVADANKAIELNPSNPKAYLRKGTACFSLEEYQTARTAFEAGSKLAQEDTRFTDWIKKCDKFFQKQLMTQKSSMGTAGESPTVMDASTVGSALPYKSLIKHLQASLPSATSVIQSPIRHHHQTSSSSTLLLMPAWSLSPTTIPYTGVKLVTVHPNNSALNLTGVHATYVLFNSLTGQTLASIDGTELTVRRTACVSAIASHYLSNVRSQVLLSVGAGSLAPHLIKAHLTSRPSINRAMIWNRTLRKSKHLVSELQIGMESSVKIEVCEDLELGVQMADIVSCATTSETPLVLGGWLKPGAHLDLVGSFKPSMRECDDEAVKRGRVFVDCEAALVEAGELVGAFERGVMARDGIEGDLVELIKGDKIGRKDENEITVFVSVGSAVVDLLSAQLAYETVGVT